MRRYKATQEAACAESNQQIGMVEFIGILSVHLISGSNLVSRDFNGLSDPYVILASAPARSPESHYPGQQIKSRTIMRSLNPQFDELLTVCITDLDNDVLHLTVMDYDRLSKDDPMGEAILHICNYASKLRAGESVAVDVKLEKVKKGVLFSCVFPCVLV